MKFYSRLLMIYPRDFRSRFAAGMRASFAEDYARARARGRLAGFLFLAMTVPHTVWFALMQRVPTSTAIASFMSVDLRDALRSLWTTPLVTSAAVLSLALGIGANTALFSILNGLVIRELPVYEPQRLAVIEGSEWTNPIWEEIRARQSDLFDSACAWSVARFNLADSGRADPVSGAYVSGGLFRTLGVTTVVGRPLAPSDDVRGGGRDGHVAVISHRFWQQRFNGAGDVLGRRLSISRVPFTIVGVTPKEFLGPEVGRSVDVFLPLAAEAAIRGRESALDRRASWWLEVMIRLRSGQTIEAATAALNAARPAIREATIPLDWNADYRSGYLKDEFALLPAATGVSSLRNRFEEPLTIIMMVVAAVLLIACANIANLMLARAAVRRHEMSVRLALGASRARLACQLFGESLFVAFVGGAAGLVLAKFGAALLVSELGSEISSVTLDLSIDWRVLAFTAAVGLGATLLFGVAPVLGLRTVEPNHALKEHSRAIAGERGSGVRGVLVVVQVALSFTLVAAAALFMLTFAKLVATPLGFDPANLLIVSIDAGRTQVSSDERVALANRVAEAAATVPGVSRASLSFMTPMSGQGWNHRVAVAGGPVVPRPQQTTWVNAVAPGWFETYGTRLIAGRDFGRGDVEGGPPVAVVNEAFVRRFVGAQQPVGQRVNALGLGVLKETAIVGVVNDAVYRNARAGAVPTMYLPIAQAGPLGSSFAVTVKSTSPRQEIERGVTEAMLRTDPNLAVSYRDYSDQVRATVIQERLVALLSGFFGMLALLLAALGLYGVTSYSVSRRQPEIALRIALGASAGGVMRLVLGHVFTLLAAGTAIGVVLSVWAARFVDALLFRVDPRDPIALGGTAAILIALGVFAGWLPARKAARLDPSTALRGAD